MTAVSPWTSCAKAAAELGISRMTIRRRIEAAPHWREGRHYRHVKQQRRTVLLVHVPNAKELIRAHGW